MIPGAALASRNAGVRAAARAWHQAELLTAEGLAAVESEFPDDRVRVGPVFRVLLFVFTLIAAGAGTGFIFALVSFGRGSEAVIVSICWTLAVVAIFATEFQVQALKRAQGGTEAATSFAALVLLLAGAATWVFALAHLPDRDAAQLLFALATLACAAAAWRWGYPLYGAFAAASLLGLLSTLIAGRLWIALVAILALFLLPRHTDSARLPPALRDAVLGALLVFLAGLYLAVDVSSVQWRLLELPRFIERAAPDADASPWTLRAALAATVLVPALYIAWGLRGRRRAILVLGLFLAACAAASVRLYIHLAAPWIVLSVAGLLLITLALIVRRYLDAGEDRERLGFTAEPPLEGQERQRLLELVAATATLTPDARVLPQQAAYQGHGGDFGGAGSNSDF
jgi:MFS family permease